MTNQQKAERFGRIMAHRYGSDLISKEAALTMCIDFGTAHAKQCQAQDRMSFWARQEFNQYLNPSF